MNRTNDRELSNTEDLPASYGNERVPACDAGPDAITDRPLEDDADARWSNARWPNAWLRQKPVPE